MRHVLSQAGTEWTEGEFEKIETFTSQQECADKCISTYWCHGYAWGKEKDKNNYECDIYAVVV